MTEAGRRGICYGFEPQGALALSSLRQGSGQTLDVQVGRSDGQVAPVLDGPAAVEWRARADNPFSAELYPTASGWGFHVHDLGWFTVDPVRRRVTVPAGEPVSVEQRLWGIPAALCYGQRGDIALHASAVDVGGRALAFVAPGRFGKTTLAAGFAASGHRVLAEDLVCIRPGAQPAIIPGPPTLRLRPDVAPLMSIPDARVLLQTSDRTHLLFEGPASGTGDPVPLGAIVLLNVAEEEPRLERVSAARALPSLWATSFKVPGDAAWRVAFDRLGEIVNSAPLWELHRELRLDTLPDLVELLVDRTLRGAGSD